MVSDTQALLFPNKKEDTLFNVSSYAVLFPYKIFRYYSGLLFPFSM